MEIKNQIDIIGKGRVGYHLNKAFSKFHDVELVNSRNLENLRNDSEIYIISVSDNAIEEVTNKLKEIIPKSAIVAHTSGSIPIDILKNKIKHYGVFYPLQTFSKQKELDYKKIPIFIEGNDQFTCNKLAKLAKTFSPEAKFLNSDGRKHLHIASVLACNFVNHLWHLSDLYLNKYNLTFDYIRPLIAECCDKVNCVSPYEAQTGPACRNDVNTIQNHLDALKDDEEILNIYSILTKSIIKYHTNKNEPDKL